MLGTKWRKVMGDVMSRKARTAMVSLSIFIGVLGVVTIGTMRDLIFTELHASFAPELLPMSWAYVGLDEDQPADEVDDEATLEKIRSYPEVTVAEGWGRGRLYWREQEQVGFIEGIAWGTPEKLSALEMQPFTLVEGEYPVAGQREMAVNYQMAKRYGLEVGDSLVVRLLSGISGTVDTATEIPEETWTVSAIVYHPYLYDNGDHSVYFDFEEFSRITGVEHFTVFHIRFTDFAVVRSWFGESFNDLLSAGVFNMITTETPYRVTGLGVENPLESGFVSETESWGEPLNALGLLAMLVSSFLVVTVISTIIVEQKQQIGVMKSLGAGFVDNFSMYAGIAVVYGLLGAVPGALLGIPVGYYLTSTLVMPLTNLMLAEFTISYSTVAIGLVLGVLMPFLAAVIPVILGTRVSILNAITDLGISTKYGKGAGTEVIRMLPLPLSTRQAVASVYTRKGRLTMTGITLTLAVGTFIGVSAVFISLGDTLFGMFDTFNYDLTIYPTSPEDYDYDEVGRLITEAIDGENGIYPALGFWPGVVPGLDNGTSDRMLSMRVNGFDTATDSLQFELLEGDGWEVDSSREGIVLTRMAADEFGVGLGDVLTLKADNNAQTLEVIGIIAYPEIRGFTSWEVMADLAGKDRPVEYWLRFGEDLASGQVDQKIGTIRESLLEHGIVASFYNQQAWVEDQTRTLWSIAMIFNIASLIMAAVGAVGLLAMLSISVFERQREIGVMRTVGATSRTVAGQFLSEGLAIGVIAWCLGLPLSYAIAQILAEVLPLDGFEFNYPALAPILGMIGMLAIATLSGLWPSVMASRKTVSNILRYR